MARIPKLNNLPLLQKTLNPLLKKKRKVMMIMARPQLESITITINLLNPREVDLEVLEVVTVKHPPREMEIDTEMVAGKIVRGMTRRGKIRRIKRAIRVIRRRKTRKIRRLTRKREVKSPVAKVQLLKQLATITMGLS